MFRIHINRKFWYSFFVPPQISSVLKYRSKLKKKYKKKYLLWLCQVPVIRRLCLYLLAFGPNPSIKLWYGYSGDLDVTWDVFNHCLGISHVLLPWRALRYIRNDLIWQTCMHFLIAKTATWLFIQMQLESTLLGD